MLAQFAVRMICGMSLVLSVMPQTSVASHFFRIQMLIIMGLGVLASLASSHFTTGSSLTNLETGRMVGCILLGILGFLGSVFWTLERRQMANWILRLTAVVSVASLGLGVALIPGQWRLHWTIVFLSDVSAALTLGAAMCGMLLGHSYLTSPTMSISPLARLNQYLGFAGIGRGILSAVVIALAWSHLAGANSYTWLSLRWIAGIFGPIMVWQMVSRILTFRNTQAATGVLFVGVILTLLGELTGILLLATTGYPL